MRQGRYSVQTGHIDIESDDVGIQLGYFFQSLRSASGGANDLEAGLASDHSGERDAHEGAVIHDQDSNRTLQ